MVNFGYGPGMKYWREDRKGILAERLDTLVGKTKFKLKPPYDMIERNDEGVMKTIYPYVETDRLYDGVRIRKITHLTKESMDDLLDNAEWVYKEVMLEPEPISEYPIK